MLYNQIKSNKRKSALLIIAFFLLVLTTGWAIGYLTFGDMYSGAIIAAVVLAFHIPISYYSAGKRVMSMSGAREVTQEQFPELYNIVEELTIPARLPMPKIYVVNDEAPNAFASGISPEKANVAVTTGLLQILNREELEGVIAHELAHIRNFDIRLMSLSISLVSVIVLIAEIGSRFMFYGGGNKRNNDNKNPILMVVAIVLVLIAPLLGQMMKLMVSRNREYLADATAVELTRNPEGLKGALTKISSQNLTVKKASSATAGMYIYNPFKRKKKEGPTFFENLMSTHPPVKERIGRLENM